MPRPLLSARSWVSLLIAGLLIVSLVPGAIAQPSSGEVRRDLEAVRDRLDEIDQQRGQALNDYNDANEALEQANQRLATLRDEVSTLSLEHDSLTEVVEHHVRRLHKMGPALELSTIVVASNPTEAGNKAATMRRILDGQRTDLEALSANQTEIDATEARLVDAQREAEDLAAHFDEKRNEIDALFTSTEDEVRAAEEQLAETLAREEEERRQREEEARLRREAEAERQRQAELAAQRRVDEQRAAEQRAEQRAAQQRAEEEAERQRAEERAAQQREQERAASDTPAEQQPETNAAPEPEPDPAPSTRSSADVAVQTALAQLGKPYAWGGGGPGSFDCSGLVSFAWRAAGVSLPRSSRAQHAAVTSISRDQLQPGDLVFYHSPVSHVAMYIGGNRVVEAPNSGGVVRIREDGLTRRGVVGFGRP